MNILIAEDDATSRIYLKKLLEPYGNCSVAINGLEAIEKVENMTKEGSNFELICLDIMMPKVNGITALKAIREKEKKSDKTIRKSVVIMTTALNDKKTINESYEHGCDAFIWKPIDVAAFKKLLIELHLI